MPDTKHPPITHDPETHSGAPVFTGHGSPVKVLFDYLADGQSIDAFVQHYPLVSAHKPWRRWRKRSSSSRSPVSGRAYRHRRGHPA